MTPALIDAAGKAFAAPFDAVLELRPEAGDPIFVDGRVNPPAVNAAPPADKQTPDCIWHCPADTLKRVLTSSRAIENAVINGRLTIAGDMSVMARLEMANG